MDQTPTTGQRVFKKEESPPRPPGKFGIETPIEMFNRLAMHKVYMEPPPFVVTGPFLYKRRPMKVILPRERKVYPKRTVNIDCINSKSPDYLSKKKVKKPKKEEKLPPEPKHITVPVIDWGKSELFYKC